MPKFKGGGRVRISTEKREAPPELRGAVGTVLYWIGEKSKESRPITVELPPVEWEPAYIVQFDDLGAPRVVSESWLLPD